MNTVLDECRTHSWTRGSSVASGSLRPFGPVSGSNVACGSSVLYLTREGQCHTHICKLGAIQFGWVSQALVDTRCKCGLWAYEWFECLFVVHPIFLFILFFCSSYLVHPIFGASYLWGSLPSYVVPYISVSYFCTSYFWFFLSLRFPFLTLWFLISVDPMFGVSYFCVPIFVSSYLYVTL